MALGKSSIVGQVVMWSGSIVSLSGEQEPVSGWLLCNGASLDKLSAKYASLYNIIGIQFGSDVSNFFLPDMRGRFPLGKSGSFALASTGGVETVTLALANLPSHSHTTASFSTGDSGSSGHTHGTVATGNQSANHTHQNKLPSKNIQEGSSGSTVSVYSASSGTLRNNTTLYGDMSSLSARDHTHNVTPSTAGAHTHTVTMGGAGSSGSHTNMPPFTSVHFLIKY